MRSSGRIRQSYRRVSEPLEQRLLLSVSLVDDINQVATSTTALGQLTDNNGTLLFADNDGRAGAELWKSDGTSAGSSLVKDINPGSASSSPTSLTSINGEVYFSALDVTHGSDLWKSDGTSAGTVQLATGGAYLSQPNDFVSYNGLIYFFAYDTGTTNIGGLWETDGNTTHEIKNLNDSFGYGPSNLTVFNGSLYFFNNGTTAGGELEQSDGTAAGTVVVKTFTGASTVANLTVAGPQMFFTFGGNRLYTSNGTSAGTTLIATIGPGTASTPDITDLTAMNGSIYFAGNDGVTGSELWTSNGTSASEVKDIFPGSNASSPSYLTVFNGKLYFQAADAANHAQLWSSDGTAANTTMVIDLATQPQDWRLPSYLLAVGPELYFSASGISYQSIWMTDGTAAGTNLVYQFSSSRSSVSGQFVSSGSNVFFPATTPTYGLELWETLGTAASTQMVKDIYPGTASSAPILGPTLNGELFLSATDGVNSGTNVWKTNGTTAGTILVFNVYADGSRTFKAFLGATSNYVYFSVTNTNIGNNHYELWRTDGTSSGTIMLAQYSYSISNITLINGNVFYIVASQGSPGTLCTTDGTAAGTKSVVASNLLYLQATLNGVAYGVGSDDALWRTDGTAAGTYLLSHFYSGNSTLSPAGLAVVGDDIFFLAISSVNTDSTELYKSDGTTAGTVLISTIPNTFTSGPAAAVGGHYYFAAGTGSQLWVSDGTSSGTHAVSSQNLTNAGNFAPLNGNLLFWADDGSNGNYDRLYRSDGTSTGTYPLGTVYPEGNGTPQNNAWAQIGNAYYVVSSYPSVAGIWHTDGTSAGTYLIDSVTPVSNVYEPLGNQLLFRGNDGIHGDELWQYTIDAAPLVVQSANCSAPASGLSLNFSFNRPAWGYAGPASLTLQNLNTGVTYTTVSQVISGGNLIVTFPGTTALPAGIYVATLPAGAVADTNGNPLGVSYAFSFLSVPSGGNYAIPFNSSGHTVLGVSGVTIAGTSNGWAGTLDINNGDLDVSGGSLPTLKNQIGQGYAGGTWRGEGITSSTGASDSAHLTAIGIIQNNQGGSPIYTAANPLDGTTPGPGDILIKYTYYGDANLDGKIDGSDYSQIDNGFLNKLTGWFNGDFNYDGVVDGSDYTLIDNTYNQQGASLASHIAAPSAEVATNVAKTNRLKAINATLFSTAQINAPVVSLDEHPRIAKKKLVADLLG